MSEDVTAVHGAWTPDGETQPPMPKISEDAVISVLKTVFDPEIPVDIYELGLIYAVEIEDDGKVKVEMTLTTPSCPSAQELPAQVEEASARCRASPTWWSRWSGIRPGTRAG